MLEKLTGGSTLGKGGAREASGLYVVAKGMSLQDHYNALLFASLNTKFRNKELLNYLNINFGRFGADGATETARSWVKELVRYGMLIPVDKNCKEIEVNEKNWSSGIMRLYQITNYGRACLTNHQLFPYEIAKSVFASYILLIGSALTSFIVFS